MAEALAWILVAITISLAIGLARSALNESNLRRKNESLQLENDGLDASLTVLNGKLISQVRTIDGLNERVTKQDYEIINLRGNIRSLETRNAKLQREKEDAVQETKSYRLALDAYSKDRRATEKLLIGMQGPALHEEIRLMRTWLEAHHFNGVAFNHPVEDLGTILQKTPISEQIVSQLRRAEMEAKQENASATPQV